MKKKLLRTIEDLIDQGIDLKETPALFKWSYDEHPDYQFQMLIKKVNPDEVVPDEEIIH